MKKFSNKLLTKKVGLRLILNIIGRYCVNAFAETNAKLAAFEK